MGYFVTGPIVALVQLIAQNLKPKMQVAEVGVFDGSTTAYYLTLVAMMGGHVYAVDWFQGNFESTKASIGVPKKEKDYGVNISSVMRQRHTYTEENQGYSDDLSHRDTIRQRFNRHIAETGWELACTVLQGLSWEAGKLIPDNSLDICFIDAGHEYDAVCKDIDLYITKMKKGSILCGHDFAQGPVRQAVYDKLGNVTSIDDPLGHQQPIWIYNV